MGGRRCGCQGDFQQGDRSLARRENEENRFFFVGGNIGDGACYRLLGGCSRFRGDRIIGPLVVGGIVDH